MVALELDTRLPSLPLVMRSLCTEYPDAAASRLYSSAVESLLLVVVSSGRLLIGFPEQVIRAVKRCITVGQLCLPRGLTSRVKDFEDIVLCPWCEKVKSRFEVAIIFTIHARRYFT